MKYFLLLAAVIFLLLPAQLYSQEKALPNISADWVKNAYGMSLLGFDEWKYQPGDDPLWADPAFDDSEWYDISPGDIGIDEMPDSLWIGYGWWRLSFTADSLFYKENWTLFYNSWGAAEVYLDGQLLQHFGEFSIDPNKEKTYSPYNTIDPPIRVNETDTHTLAVRYSYHQAKSYNFIIKEKAGDLGFNIGFGKHAFNQRRVQEGTYNSFSLFFSSAVLFVLLLLHLMLFYKFPKDQSNLFISLAVGLLLISCVAIHCYVYADVNSYWDSFLRWVFKLSVSMALLFLPFVTAEIFKLENFKKLIWLIAVFLPAEIMSFFNEEIGFYIYFLFAAISFFLVGYICWKAYRSGKKGVYYVAFGALGTLSSVLTYMFGTLGFIEISTEFRPVIIVLQYTLFPLGMTLYVADSYGYLFTSLESEISERTKKLSQSLEDLRATQTQLIQQEKLASLGQLTAGIAHEIKNPLNFVNNFSDLSMELIDEAFEELQALGENEKAKEAIGILEDVKSNLSKIHEHGTRADSIVKSMLLHSRGSDGKMEPTALNALVKEYVNLTFHGMRAGKNPINVDINYELDESIGEVPLIAEDFSRVLINLCNNAFDACAERSRSTMKEKEKGENGKEKYMPRLGVRTKKNADKILIEIEDNGPGIPEEIKDKILQPFFTTKKGTEGTGLGLSITNDIIKAHGGSLSISSKTDDSTIFIIHLAV